MQLTTQQRKFLRAKAHPLKVVVSIGAKGITPPVIQEIDQALAHHELIKLKLPAEDKAAKQERLESLCASLNAAEVQLIGRVGILYRAADKPVIVLP